MENPGGMEMNESGNTTAETTQDNSILSVDEFGFDNNSDSFNGDEIQTGVAIPKSGRSTTLYLTKYEKARVLGTRAIQISHNAPIMVDLDSANGEKDPLRIAEKELRQKKIPITIRRFLPDGSYEDWDVNELISD